MQWMSVKTGISRKSEKRTFFNSKLWNAQRTAGLKQSVNRQDYGKAIVDAIYLYHVHEFYRKKKIENL